MKIKEVVIHKKDLKGLLAVAGITLKELAVQTGLGYTRLFNYQSEYRTCDINTWQKIDKILKEQIKNNPKTF